MPLCWLDHYAEWPSHCRPPGGTGHTVLHIPTGPLEKRFVSRQGVQALSTRYRCADVHPSLAWFVSHLLEPHKTLLDVVAEGRRALNLIRGGAYGGDSVALLAC